MADETTTWGGKQGLGKNLFFFVNSWQALDVLQEERFFPAFKKSPLYIKCLAELDLLKDDSLDSRLGDDESIQIDSSPENSNMGVSSVS